MSQLKVNSIVDAAGGSSAVLYGVASPPNSMGFRNRIINGSMVIDQRNAGASATPTDGQYTLDRWKFQVSQASKLTAQQNAGSVTPPAGFTKYLGVTSSSAYSVAAGDYFGVYQLVEGLNFADLAWGTANAQTATLSFWVRSSLTGTFGGGLKNGNSTRSYPFNYTISAANTWEYKTIVIPGDTSGTWYPDTGTGVQVNFNLGTGATYSGTAGAWASANYVSATGATSVVGTNGATFYITGVQLEAGSVATPFERRDYGRELMMCQRYAYIHAPVATSANLAVNNQKYWHDFFPVVMRATPAYSVLSGAWTNATPNDIALTPRMARLGVIGGAEFYSSTNVTILYSAEL